MTQAIRQEAMKAAKAVIMVGGQAESPITMRHFESFDAA